MMELITGKLAVMWGPSIIGFGSYRYPCGKDCGTMCRLGFSPRKAEPVPYVLTESPQQDGFLARLGKHKNGRSCLYLKRLSDVGPEVLEALTAHTLDHMNRKYPGRRLNGVRSVQLQLTETKRYGLAAKCSRSCLASCHKCGMLQR
jgi:hypothetical protein